MSASLRGKVTGSFPEGLTSPNRTSARALPCSWPLYQLSSTAGTRSSQGIKAGPPVASTTMVRGLATATTWMSRSCSLESVRLGRSACSLR